MLGTARGPLFLSIAGNIGAGKTTAARLVAEALDLRTLEEPVVDNRFLASYYADMKRWSFTLQMEFLLRRVEHARLVETTDRGCIQDRTLLEDPEVFAKYLHGLGNMTDRELELYLDYCRMLVPSTRQPDAIIHLDCGPVDTLLARIAERGRPEERGIQRQFLHGLSAYYATLPQVFESKYGIPTLSVDISELDIRTGAGRTAFLEKVDGFLRDRLGIGAA